MIPKRTQICSFYIMYHYYKIIIIDITFAHRNFLSSPEYVWLEHARKQNSSDISPCSLRPGVSKPDTSIWVDSGASDVALTLEARCWHAVTLGHALWSIGRATRSLRHWRTLEPLTCSPSSITLPTFSHPLLAFPFGWRKTWMCLSFTLMSFPSFLVGLNDFFLV